jgi:hypothetical protein
VTPPGAAQTSPPRPARFVVLAVLHLCVATASLLWTAALVAFGFVFTRAYDSSAAGVATIVTVAALNAAKVVSLVTGALGLVRCRPYGWYATVAFGLLGIAEALILLATGGSTLLVTALLIYPVTALVLVTAPQARRAAGVR